MNAAFKGLAIAAALALGVAAQPQPQPATPALHARQPRRLVIKNAMVIYGNAKPPYGPVDIVVQDGVISYIGATSDVPSGARASSDAAIDASGKYVMPGIVNAHMHWHEERQPGVAQPIQYERNLYLAAGVTTVREVGGDFDKSKRWQAESNAHTIVAPRILVDPRHQAEGRRRSEDHRHGSRPARSDPRRGAPSRAADGDAHRRRGDDGE